MMRGVVARWNRKDVIQFAAVESPVANKFLGQLLVPRLHLGNRGAQRSQITSHARMLAVLVKNQPVGMFLSYLRNNVFVRLPSALPIFNTNRQPPELHQFSLLMKIVDHLLDRISRERVWPRIPISVGIEPAIIERGPLDVHLFEFGNRSSHLRRRDIE